jgi:glycosyltransferase involved in cell wall biosynthesis
LVAREGIAHVLFTGHVSNSELTAYYDAADVLLCASEHEGFCVPIIEAFYKQVPVVAFRAAAVPATMDGGGILYESKDPGLVAGLIDAVVSDEGLRRDVIARQDEALGRLQRQDFRTLLLGFVEQAMDSALLP